MKTKRITAPRETVIRGLKETFELNQKRLDQSSKTSNKRQKLYYVTCHYKPPINGTRNSIEQNLEYISASIPRVYNHILNKVVQRHKFKCRKKLHPFMMSFVDFSGTREHAANFVQLPHSHSILALHPDTETRFLKLVDQDFRLNENCENTNNMRKVDVFKIGVTEEDLETLIDYSAKSYLMDFIPYVSPEMQTNMLVMNG